MITNQLSKAPNFQNRRVGRGLACLLLICSISGGWQRAPGIAQGQTSGFRFTESLKFQEIEPGIEYGQTTRGQATKDERTGPWFINVLRIDLALATLKIVHALDEGVGLETVSSLAARHGATAATNGGYFRIAGTYRGDSIGLLVLDRDLISEPNNERAALGLIDAGSKTEVVFGHLRFSGEISMGSMKHSVQGLNRPLSADELIIFTSKFSSHDPNESRRYRNRSA